MRARRAIVLALLCGMLGNAPADWYSEAGIEGRWFPQDPMDPAQESQGLSLHLQTEYHTSWDDGEQSFTFKPFLRLDQRDDARTHFDIREAVWIRAGEDWEVRLGIDKVFWGVTEVYHLVDIVNQTDVLENPDGEQKLGQPLLKYSMERDWGTLDAYLLPWFRERPYPGREGRLRSHPRVDVDQARYDNDLEDHYPGFALRWSRSIGDWDLGVTHFHGTSREPRLTPGVDGGGRPVLIPNYDLIDQTGIDAQATLGDWLWKLEAIRRSGWGKSYIAATGGFEFTRVGIAGTDADLGLLMEVMYDEREDAATTPFNQDVFLGLRWVANDVPGSEVLGGVVVDWDNGGRFFNLEASRRVGGAWKASLQMRAWSSIDRTDPVYAFYRDDYVEARLTRYF
jgi:hypothetical protein